MSRASRAMILLACAVFAGVASASEAVGVTPTVVGRGTYDEFQVKSQNAYFDFKAKADPRIDIVVRTHAYAADATTTTGWHTHPGPVFITVKTGTLTVYEYDDPTCTPIEVEAGEGYVDTGRGHMVRNESGAPAEDVTVIIAPVGLPFRGELTAPSPYCGF
jgi:hypothetical protein